MTKWSLMNSKEEEDLLKKLVDALPVDSKEQKDLLEKLLHAVPDLGDIYKECYDRNDEIIVYYFGARVIEKMLTWEAEAIKQGHISEKVTLLLKILEEEYIVGDDSVQNLVALGFLENLIGKQPENQSIQGRLGKNLRRQFDQLAE